MSRDSILARNVILTVIFAIFGTTLLAQPVTSPAVVKEHPGRREQSTPGLVLESGARTAACDVLSFTKNGDYLFATGDDKVVRSWSVEPSGEIKSGETLPLRWPIFREMRGNIYTAALSSDETQVVVAGHGQFAGGFAAAVIERATGKILHGTGNPDGHPTQGTIWACAFSPNARRVALGTEKGVVWLWDVSTGKLDLIGRHLPRANSDPWLMAIRFVAFDGEDRVISIGGNGEMRGWNRSDPGKGDLLHEFGGPIAAPAVLSPDRTWLAAIPEGVGQGRQRVELVSFPDGKRKRIIPFSNPTELPHRVAFSAQASLLAVAIRRVGQPSVDKTVRFLQERGGHVLVFDLTQGNPELNPISGPVQGLYAEGMSFHPKNDQWLAIAGDSHHEVVLWDWKAKKKVSEVVQPGRCLWGIKLAPDGTGFAFQDQRHLQATDPNQRGTGPWRYFDLKTRSFLAQPPFDPNAIATMQSAKGWKVLTVNPANPQAHVWLVKSPDGQEFPLPWSRGEDEMPRCFTFLPAGPKENDKLVVGHYWGMSIFELTPKGPRRIRLLRGHDGYVTGVSLSMDGKRLVTSSRDMTIAGWTVEEWPNNPRIGAELFIREDSLIVGKVATGSPFWEMGIQPGDELIGLRSAVRTANDDVQARNVFFKTPLNHALAILNAVGTPKDAEKYLTEGDVDFTPGSQHLFYWKTKDDPQVYVGATTLVERPLWRFFPHGEQEWVLWQWRDYYYDCSTRGDSFIGWQRNHARDRWKEPVFFKAEQLRSEFLRPERIANTLTTWRSDQDVLVQFNSVEPPEITVSEPKKIEGGYKIRVTARARGTRDSQKPARLLVWLNDYLLTDVKGNDLILDEGEVTHDVTVRSADLRQGDNVIISQCYGRGGSRGDSAPQHIKGATNPARQSLHGLLIGVGNYRRSKPRQVDLKASEDARVIAFALGTQRNKGMFAEVRVTPMLDEQATREAILAKLDAMKGTVAPDDVFVFHLGGHGTSRAKLEELKKRRPQINVAGLGRFLFMCGNFDLERIPDTTVSFEDLHDRLSKLPCHKIILLDACHSGEARTSGGDTESNPVRILTQHGIGCTILAACGPDQEAIENYALDAIGGGQGLFTIAIRRLLEERAVFAEADRDKNGKLESAELASGLEAQVKYLVARHNELRKLNGEKSEDIQTPVGIVPRLEERVPIATR